jgi:transcriptional regulator with XRE-family HTH domain
MLSNLSASGLVESANNMSSLRSSTFRPDCVARRLVDCTKRRLRAESESGTYNLRPVATPRQKQVKVEVSPGQYLRERRLQLGMQCQEVQEASSMLARHERNMDMFISAPRLVQIESGSEPGNHKLLSLAAIYGLDFLDLLARYGVRPDRLHYYRTVLQQKRTQTLSTEIHDLETTVTLPLHMDPRCRFETTQLVNQMVAVWGEIPAAMLMNFNPRDHIVGLVGLEDHTMSPLIRPGCLLLVDDRRRKIVDTAWTNEHDRPIYFIELRDGFRCAWCQLNNDRLFLIPHPLSHTSVESFSFPNDAEVVGQVVGIAMRIVPTVPNLGPGPKPEEPPASVK